MCLAIPGRILEIGPDAVRTARLAFGAVVKEASLALLPEAQVGDYVIVHAGVGLQILDQQAALEVFEALRQLDEAAQEGESLDPGGRP